MTCAPCTEFHAIKTVSPDTGVIIIFPFCYHQAVVCNLPMMKSFPA